MDFGYGNCKRLRKTLRTLGSFKGPRIVLAAGVSSAGVQAGAVFADRPIVACFLPTRTPRKDSLSPLCPPFGLASEEEL